ncbi:hypothetical protein [Streptomyces sp. NPDC048272]|uniref:hypothetical protein n=1 Tax=Streptomyces sp. NPDC048272 TaxID=3154616 RepID=UPI00343A8CFB
MTTQPDHRGSADSGDVREARLAIDAFLARTSPETGDGRTRPGSEGPDTHLEGRRTTGLLDDRLAEQVAREAWDAVQEATPPAPDPHTDAGPLQNGRPSPELAERHRRAVSIARGLLELGYQLDETLRPGPDMAAG